MVALAGTALVTVSRTGRSGSASRSSWRRPPPSPPPAVAGAGSRRRLSGASFSWRQPAGGLVVLLAVLTPVLGALWWVATGSGGPLDRGPASPVPTYMTDAATADPASGVLLVRGSRERGFTYVLLRGPGPAARRRHRRPVDRGPGVADPGGGRTSPPLRTPPTSARWAGRGSASSTRRPRSDAALVGNLDSVSGLSPGSAPSPGARAWQLEGRRTPAPASAG